MGGNSFYEYLINKGYERRSSQEEFITLMEELIEEGGVKLIEAPTGTGKTFAYLIPIITRDEKAIVSTGTKILQDQLRRDVEFLTGHYKLLTGKEVSYLIMKGKGNYLCLDRYYKERLPVEELGDVPELLETEWEGDLTLSSCSYEALSKLNIDDDYCTPSYRNLCPHRTKCYYWERLKSRERKAQILVINHALLALKEFDDAHDRLLIIDEAHELDRYLTLASTGALSVYWFRELIGSLEKLLDRELKLNPEEFFRENFEKLFKEESQEVALDTLTPYMPALREKLAEPLKNLYMEFRNTLVKEVEEFLESRLMISYKLKGFLESTLVFPPELLERFRSGYDDPDERERELIEKVKKIDYLERKLQKLNAFIRLCEEEKPEYGYKISRAWSKKLQTFNYRIEVFPVFPRGVVETEAYKGVLLTSATIDPEDIRFTTGIEGDFYRLSHNFDYSKVTFLIMNTNPKRKEWERDLITSFETIKNLHERVLVLLTNRNHMKFFENTSEIVKQGEGSLNSLVEKLREGEIKILIGLDSLWTGIDVRGDKGILMSKLPFESPDDPVTYHRIKYLNSIGEDPFEYQRRKAFIKFRQGVGRLMRQKTDSGTIILCDNRVWRYKEFINFLRELGVNIVYEKNFTARRT
ncbi:ATP-dependent DNA helicase DinG [Hydrogenivirga caldilitoris]|uniref:DNA 5'-3' helicase n=1 Tax=Hydrogenivirga caldilitoris TaxID=246264 RepID=A0A497XPX1_9AQUI|nr:ATP-dependent DNA helicase [Hydrogenivirga caldilitoris]RLJ70169.1 ATP-dependent DNA helicase DinG [Hydrogenivirga caldilitoris]